jgi:hypothetical protein
MNLRYLPRRWLDFAHRARVWFPYRDSPLWRGTPTVPWSPKWANRQFEALQAAHELGLEAGRDQGVEDAKRLITEFFDRSPGATLDGRVTADAWREWICGR